MIEIQVYANEGLSLVTQIFVQIYNLIQFRVLLFIKLIIFLKIVNEFLEM
jgi:hypothetical protein